MQMPSSVVLRRTADLVPYANNARTHTPEQVKQIAASERRAARGRGPLRAGRGRDRDRNVGLAANPGLPHVPARPHRMALLSIGICWAVATINAQLSPGQNRQSSPLITPAYHGLESLVIAGQERPTDWLRIPAPPPCLPPRPLEPARRSRRRGPTITPRGTPALMQDRPCSGARCRSAFASVAIPFL
jgi:hypothetical protein